MNKFLTGSKLFLKRNSSTILTCIGAVGVAATAVLAVRATPKAMKIIQANEESKEEKLTKMEIIKCAGPAYIPSMAVGISTIACMFGANVLNKRKQAGLISAYALLNETYKEYKNEVSKVLDEESREKVMKAIVHNHIEDADAYEREEGKDLFFDFYSFRLFNSTVEDVENTVNYVNDLFDKYGYVGLSDFNNALGLENDDTDFEMGWSLSAGNYSDGPRKIDFEILKTDECYIIVPAHDPVSNYYWQ